MKKKEIIKKGVAIIIVVLLGIRVWQWEIDKYTELNSLQQEIEELKEEIEEQKKENREVKLQNELLEERNDGFYHSMESLVHELGTEKEDYREFLLEEKLLIELEKEQSDGEIPIYRLKEENILNGQPHFSDYPSAMMSSPAMIYCPDEDKIKLHFKLDSLQVYAITSEPNEVEVVEKRPENWEFTCTHKGKPVQVERDEENPDYYFVILDEKGYYLFDEKFENDLGEECHQYFFVKW